MPEGVGYEGDKGHDRLVKDIEEQFRHLEQVLKDPYENMVRWWRLYLAQQDDPRTDEEKEWRSNVFVPYPYSVVETEAAAHAEILNSTDPLVQAEGVGDEDEGPAKTLERLLDYQLRMNRWRRKLFMFLRECGIQGVVPFKTYWVEKSMPIVLFPTKVEWEDFNKALLDALKLGAPPPPDLATEPKNFEAWRRMVNTAKKTSIPEPPYGGRQRFVQYRGPWHQRISLFDLFFDPHIEDIQDQPIVIHRMILPLRWLLERTGPGEDKKFDPGQVAAALSGWGGERHAEQDRSINDFINLSDTAFQDPIYEKGVELWEVFRPTSPECHLIILNRKTIINKNPTAMPFWHGQIPITFLRRSQIPGRALGISAIQQPEKLFYELQALRNLRVDAVTLATLPVLARLREMGMSDKQRKIRPGAVFESSRPDAWQQLTKIQVAPEIFREIPDIKNDIDEANATGGNVRGNQATIGRVSATESQGRLTQALTRMKHNAIAYEEDLQSAVEQSSMLWYQFAKEDLRVNVGGKGGNVTVKKAELMEALAYNMRFRGATRAVGKDMLVQQLNQFGKDFATFMSPTELRALMDRIYETMGMKGKDAVLTPETTKLLQTAFEAETQARIAQAQMAAQPPPVPGAPPDPNDPDAPPAELDAEQMAAIAGAGGDEMQEPATEDLAASEAAAAEDAALQEA